MAAGMGLGYDRSRKQNLDGVYDCCGDMLVLRHLFCHKTLYCRLLEKQKKQGNR